jgi:membrane protease YdiL (CAAX protease family)
MNTQLVGYKAKAFESRNLIFFFLIALGLPLLFISLFTFNILKWPSTVDPGLGILLAVAQFLPLIAALVVIATTEGKSGLKALWLRFWNKDISVKWLLVILLFNPMVRLIGNLISRAAGGEHYPFLDPNFLSVFLLGIIIGIQEEFGWRGYVLPRFQAKWNALTSSVILGVLWAPYHLGNWLLPPGQAPRQDSFWEFSLWIILISIFTTWIFNNTNGSILAAVLFHAIVTNGIVGCCGVTWAMELLLGIYLVAAIIIVAVFGPKNLVRQKREDIAEKEKVHAVSD